MLDTTLLAALAHAATTPPGVRAAYMGLFRASSLATAQPAPAPLTWTLVREYESSVDVSVTTRHERSNAPQAGRYYLETRDVNLTRGDWQVWSVVGPDMTAEDVAELEADVAHWFACGSADYRDAVMEAA